MLPFQSLIALGDPMAHVLDKNVIGPGGLIKAEVSLLTINTMSMIIAFGLLIWLLSAAAKRIETGSESEGNERYITKGRFAQMLEFLIVALRDNFVRPQLGSRSDAMMPFLLTVFFFILFNNLLGLVPLLDIQHLLGSFFGDSHFAIAGGTATGRIAVTGGLATIAFLFWNWQGIKQSGFKSWLAHFTGGAPWYIWPIMIPVEIIGLFVKPAALAIRLFANMTAGHVLLAMLIIFVPAAIAGIGVLGAPVSLISFIGGIGIFYLEVFVAFLQAFIFFFLTTVFLAQMMHDHHEDEVHAGRAEDYDAEHPMVTDPAVPVSAI